MPPAQSSLAPCHRYPRQLPWDLAPEEPLLTRWHVEGLELGVSATAVMSPSDSREGAKVIGLSGCKPTQADGTTVLPHLQREGRVHPQWGWQLLSQGGEQWTVNTLVHGKGLTYLDASPHISFTLSFSKEKEMEGKPLWGLLPYLP